MLVKRLKAYREELHKNRFEMAAEMGISEDTLSNMERERANPTLETIQEVAAYMGKTVSELLEVEEK